MTIELSEDQFKILLDGAARGRVDVLTAINDLRLELAQKLNDLKVGFGLMRATLAVLEEDVGKIQVLQREHTQSLEGLTELTSTNFDLIESMNKHIHGESSTIAHDAAIRGTRTQ
jgi:hypothetical protein